MTAKNKLKLPGPTNRTTVIGRTGSGKSQFASFLLSTQNFDAMPWIIVDFKDEDTDIINRIDRVIYITIYDPIPDRPGLYIVKPSPEDKDGMSEFFTNVLSHGNCGLFIDEVFPVGQHNVGFNTLMMQGRSRHCPVIVCTQRPANVSTYCFTEASFYYIFDLTRVSDRKKINEEISSIPAKYQMPEFHSYYYNVTAKHLDKIGPAPDAETILDRIDEKIPVQRRTL